ncbi:hypothetical protein MMC31_004339 [Peltigera leucophlebia]|nr:hypothetical protein [Peltigera leucophlebia]
MLTDKKTNNSGKGSATTAIVLNRRAIVEAPPQDQTVHTESNPTKTGAAISISSRRMIPITSPSNTTPFIEPAGYPDQVQVPTILPSGHLVCFCAYTEAVMARAL